MSTNNSDDVRFDAFNILDNIQNVESEIKAIYSNDEAIAVYIRNVIAELKERDLSEITEQRQNNIKLFVKMLPKDAVTLFWAKFICLTIGKSLILSWYDDNSGNSGNIDNNNFKKYMRDTFYLSGNVYEKTIRKYIF